MSDLLLVDTWRVVRPGVQAWSRAFKLTPLVLTSFWHLALPPPRTFRWRRRPARAFTLATSCDYKKMLVHSRRLLLRPLRAREQGNVPAIG